MIRKRGLALAVVLAFLPAPGFAYGPRGHTMVGAIADQRLAGRPVAIKIGHLLDGLSLARAARLPDDIKDWDSKDPSRPDTFHLPGHPDIERQLVDFWKANPHVPVHG